MNAVVARLKEIADQEEAAANGAAWKAHQASNNSETAVIA